MGALDADPTKIMEDYSRNSGYLVNLSQAIGRIILAGRDLTKYFCVAQTKICGLHISCTWFV